MDRNRSQEIALMRYSAISPLISGTQKDIPSLNAYFREVSDRGIKEPDGQIRHYAASTIQRWYLNYQHGGFDALLPTGRSDCGVSRKLDDDLAEQIRYIRRNYPRLSAAAIYRQLQDSGSILPGQVSEATVCRFIKQLEVEEKTTTNKDMRRYEREFSNTVWYGDTTVGPCITLPDGKKRRIYIIALIDDASRFVTGAGAFFNDTFVNVMSVIKSAVRKYGRPALFVFDNGTPYRNKQMDLLMARIGSSLSYCKPYTPQSKAKIERFYGTVKSSWMAGLDMRDFSSLDQFQGSLDAYIHMYNRKAHSSLHGKTPEERFFTDSERFKYIPEEQVDRCFLLEIERKVSIDCVIQIDNIEYEVDRRFARKRVTLRYSPDMMNIYIVEADGSLTPIRALNKVENSKVKREKVSLTGGQA